MAEVIGLVASVTTIAAVVAQCVKAVRGYHQAFKELEALEVREFRVLKHRCHLLEYLLNADAFTQISGTGGALFDSTGGHSSSRTRLSFNYRGCNPFNGENEI